jgi:hypothetical protein
VGHHTNFSAPYCSPIDGATSLVSLRDLHMVAFMTLCDAYMRMEPHFDLWNYFFRSRLQQGSDAEMTTLGNVDIFVRSGPDVDHYFPVPMPAPPVRWQKAWFLLRNDANAPLPTLTSSHPVPHRNWGNDAA